MTEREDTFPLGSLKDNPFRQGIKDVYRQIEELTQQGALIPDSYLELEAPRRVFGYRSPVRGLQDPSLIPKRVCIIGGGISGLVAAYELSLIAKEHGRPEKIDLFESSDKVGGRIRTKYFKKEGDNPLYWDYAEMGPMRIPSYHYLTRYYLKRFNIHEGSFITTHSFHISDFDNSEKRNLDNTMSEATATRFIKELFAAQFPNPLQEVFDRILWGNKDSPALSVLEDNFSEELLGLDPLRLQGLLYSERGEKEAALPRPWEIFLNAPYSTWGRVMEGLTVRQGFEVFLRNRLTLIGGGREPSRSDLARAADFLWETCGRLLGLVWLEHISMAHFLREATALSAKEKWTVIGGFQRLTDAFNKHLQEEDSRVQLHLNCRVSELALQSETGGRVQVSWQCWTGEPKADLYDRVICAVPASAVLRLNFKPELDRGKRYALASISYLSASKSAVYFKKRFWERLARPKIGGVTYTDLQNQQVWYPNDNVKMRTTDDSDEFTFESGIRGSSPRHRRLVATTPSGVRSIPRSEGPGALLAAYMWGDNANRFASLSPNERDRLIEECLECIHPGCRDLIDCQEHCIWNHETNPGGGAFAWYRPGQQSRYQEVLLRPHRLSPSGPNLICFAGEHLGLIQGWIQGAMQTSLHAVAQITDPSNRG
ncbi:MAG TPA: NAD(P)/FAD-dependent oxidoreductase [Acetobacteraceae bacterium]|nr:NAD(P)/FAD-dependent oxidoreductase [Acetobacteraceae bacterium]